MKKYYLLLLILIGTNPLFAQKEISSVSSKCRKDKPSNIHSLTIGDKVPEILLSNILNYTDSTARLSGFYKGKLLIIDFWATWCPPCIESIPVLDSIHKAMRDKVNIITVTYQDRNTVLALFSKNKKIGNTSLPFVVEDKTLSRYFPHKFVPQEVWIDSKGIVRAITDSYGVTEGNIDSLLNNDKITILTKKDSLTYDPKKYSNFQKKDILFRSVLAKTPLGIGGGWADYKYVRNYNRYYKRMFWTHRIPLQLFYAAYSHGAGNLNLKRVFFNIPDSSKYLFPTKEYFIGNDSLKALYSNYKQWLHDWEKANDYCYELITPDYIKGSLFFKYMLQDLNRGFNITGKIEKRILPCIVLRLADSGDDSKLKTNGLRPHLIWNINHDTLRGIQNEPLWVLVKVLNGFKKNDPVIDLTHYAKPVDLKLNLSNFFYAEEFDVKELRMALAKYGIKVVREKRKVDVLVIDSK